MTRKKVLDAWDDDWEAAADKSTVGNTPPEEKAPMSRAERLAKHAESNRKLWEEAEAPEEFHFLSASDAVPAPSTTTPFKPAMKVLSRKPAPQMIARKDPVTGLQQMTLQDDDEEEEVQVQETAEERRARAQRDLEEKQRRYEEVRAKIFGEASKSTPSSGHSTPGNVTPPLSADGAYRGGRGGRGRGRGGFRGGGGANHNRNDSQEKRQSVQPAQQRELFDPGYTPKPGFGLQRRGDTASPQPGRATTPRHEDQIVRTPKGPDAIGRGFARREDNAG